MTQEKTSTNTILIVDDTPENVEVLLALFEQRGFNLLVAQSGKEVFELLEQFQADLILLDVLMPNMDGFEVCRQLKAHKETREIPVIFMTLLDETVEKVRGFELGAVDYITKPFQTKEVLARVKTHLALRNLQHQLQVANEKLVHQLQQSERLNAELQKRNEELQEALGTIKTLSGLVPICAWCHKTIRNEDGEWINLETYIENHSEAKFTHGVCPACLKTLEKET